MLCPYEAAPGMRSGHRQMGHREVRDRNATARCRAEARRYEGGEAARATSCEGKALIADDEELAVVLSVELAVGADGDGGVGGADGRVEEHFSAGVGEDSGVSLGEFGHVTVLAVDVHVAERVDRGHVDAPLETVGMMAVDGGALELPLDVEIGVELSDVIRAGESRCVADRAAAAAIGCGRVMIVFDHDGKSVVVNPNAGSGIPPEVVGADVVSQRIEAEKMASRKIVIIQRAKNHGAVG